MATYLSANDLYGLGPFFLQNPMVYYALVVPDHISIIEVYVRTTMALNQLVNSRRIQVILPIFTKS